MNETLHRLGGLRHQLSTQPRSLDDIRHGHAALWRRLGWSDAQLRLWLASLADIQLDTADRRNPRYRIGTGINTGINTGTGQPGDDLGELTAQAIAALGRPMPLAQLRVQLPAGVVATEATLRAAVQAHPRLLLTGPMVSLKSC